MKLFQSAGSLNVTLEASVRQGVKLPDLAQAAQSSVRQTLEEMAGVKVDAVALLVTDILPDAAQASSGQGKG
ncbi:MAG: Asp23/Gls24 family envelope stress response protein [Clostridia bacterium]|nr:Asp23/Gls24 family envelope stress response protein [Clostridia bacterium]